MNNDFCWVTVSKRAFDDKMLQKLVEYNPAGIRFNTGRNNLDWISEKIGKIISWGYEPSKIYIDIGNEKTRIQVEHTINVVEGDIIRFSMVQEDKSLYIKDANFFSQISGGNTVLFGDGQIKCVVTECDDLSANLEVITAGEISNNTAIHICEKKRVDSVLKEDGDIKHILEKFPVSLIISFADTAEKIIRAKEFYKTKTIAKVETLEAVKNLAEIIKYTDTIIIGRGDLALECGYERIGIVEDQIIKTAKGKVDIVIATGTMLSLLTGKNITQAEVIDITYSALNASGILLTDETAKALDPFLAIRRMDKVVDAVRKSSNNFGGTEL